STTSSRCRFSFFLPLPRFPLLGEQYRSSTTETSGGVSKSPFPSLLVQTTHCQNAKVSQFHLFGRYSFFLFSLLPLDAHLKELWKKLTAVGAKATTTKMRRRPPNRGASSIMRPHLLGKEALRKAVERT